MMKRAIMGLATLALATAMGCDQSAGESSESAQAEAPTAPAESESSNNKDRYSVVSPKSTVNVGETQTVEFAVEPAGGLKINHDYPWKVTFQDAAGVEIASKTVGRSNIELSDAAAKIPVQLRANAPGDHKLAATGSFSVCNDTKCYVMRDESVEFELAATSAEAGDEKTGEAEK